MQPPVVGQLFPADVVCLEYSPIPESLSLHPQEAEAISRASTKRRREFAAGRWLARTALRQLGFSGAPLLIGPDRAPLWPAGAVGSISHTGDHCVAVVATSPPYRSLGVDVEPATSLEESLWPQICTSNELGWLLQQPEANRGRLCHLLFVVKECVYKYQAPISQTLLEFQDLDVTLSVSKSDFRAEIVRPGLQGFPVGRVLTGRTVVTDTLIMAGIH